MLLPTVQFDDEAQCFKADGQEATDALLAEMDLPLSATFQLTRNCNFTCVYCSEPPGIRTRTLEVVLAMVDKLAGMRRIIFSGGEPMAYKHFWTVLEHAQGKFERIGAVHQRQHDHPRRSGTPEGPGPLCRHHRRLTCPEPSGQRPI
jgi:Radical SAM superfamily